MSGRGWGFEGGGGVWFLKSVEHSVIDSVQPQTRYPLADKYLQHISRIITILKFDKSWAIWLAVDNLLDEGRGSLEGNV